MDINISIFIVGCVVGAILGGVVGSFICYKIGIWQGVKKERKRFSELVKEEEKEKQQISTNEEKKINDKYDKEKRDWLHHVSKHKRMRQNNSID